jgi:hypothetical protein
MDRPRPAHPATSSVTKTNMEVNTDVRAFFIDQANALLIPFFLSHAG